MKKKWVIKNNLLAEVVENRYMYPNKKKTKKKSSQYFYNPFTTSFSFRLLWVFIGGAKKLF